jgi:pimeloyl-ACP methyl ester carboxylesterase
VLPDGRRLGFAEWGAADGVPILWHPGTPGSRLKFAAAEVAERLGLRVVVVERPGFGRSDPQPGRSILDWPRDLTALADRLGLERFEVAASSGGGPYALAAARAMTDRIHGATLVACIGPLDAPGATRGMTWTRRAYLGLIRRSPRAAAWLLASGFGGKDVERLYRAMTRGLADVDQRVLQRPGVWEGQLAAIAEALSRGLGGFVSELALAAAPWGFSLSEVRVPVRVWHGSLDASTPLAMALHLATQLPRATLRVFEGEGHFLLHDHAEEILGALAK